MKSEKKLTVLLEMRPALDGYAGIPQETRLLFRGLCMIDSVEVEGLLQTSLQFLASGMSKKRQPGTEHADSARLNRYSRFVVSLDNKSSKKPFDIVRLYLKRRRATFALTILALIFSKFHKIRTTIFEARHFESFIWQTLFAKTLPASDFGLVTGKDYRVTTVPWNVMQSVGLNSLKYGSKPVYPRLDTQGVDIFIAQTPYPGRVDATTTLVVRYHDALPVFMPHAFANKARHQAIHFNALLSNVNSGAYFACVSESTRQDLLRIFPEVRDRAVTIHNMVSPHFFQEKSSVKRVPQIIRSRLNLTAPEAYPAFRSLSEQELFYKQHLGESPFTLSFNYLLMVSTIEPRKNHSRLIAAWEIIRAEVDPSIKLVIVGSLGWDIEPIMRDMRTWIDQGMLFVLNNVPAADLRVLYRHAAATVCPSLAEGFDFAGVESICSGGIAIASDIAVHREVYGDAAAYFEPYSIVSLVSTIKKVLFDSGASQVREDLRELGREVSLRYSPEKILPQWELLLNRVASTDKFMGISPAAANIQDIGAA